MTVDHMAGALRSPRYTFLCAPFLYGGLLVVIGAALAIQGFELIRLGGSAYYLVAGAMTLVAGGLMVAGRGLGSWIYGALLIGTLIWALSEAGINAWALAPRLIGPAILGLWLLVPWTVRGLLPLELSNRTLSNRAGGYAACLVLAVFLACALLPNGLAIDAPDNAVASRATTAGAAEDWPYYGGDAGGSRFSRLDQIKPANVKDLQVAWTFRTGPTPVGLAKTMEVTPIKIGDSLYLCDGANRVFALDAETGRQRWRFDPHNDILGITAGTCRGVAFYHSAATPIGQPCVDRIVATTIDGRLFELDARTGELCRDFGKGGMLSLESGLGHHVKGYYELTSAPTVARGRIVVGGWVSDNETVGEPSGVIRAFNADSGAFVWAWDIDRPGQTGIPADGVFSPGTPNVWAPMSFSDELGLVFLPTGNATPDYWGGHRSPGSEKFSSSVVAVDIVSGLPRWSFQTVHHDVWDYDVNSQPMLSVVAMGGREVPVVIQSTKRGEIFVLDQRTGQPVTKVEERAAPPSIGTGDRLATTQPYSTGMPSFAGPPLTEHDMWGLTPIDQLWCRIAFRSARYDGPMTPPGVQPTVKYPGYKGGVGWAGTSIDPERQLLIVNSSRIANYVRLIPRVVADRLGVKPLLPGMKRTAMQAQAGTPFAVSPLPFLSPLGAPCQQPPYGMISGVDMRTGKLRWTRPFGTAEDSGPLGYSSGLPISMGVPNDGAAITTRSGLTFIGATQELAFRALETVTGRELWKVRVPAGPQATPMTYLSRTSGRQFVVLAAGGHPSMRTKPGDYIIAYAVPVRKP